jgi:hypothetical protein
LFSWVMRERLLTSLGAKWPESVLSGPIFSGPVNRAQSGSERHAIEIMQLLDVHSAPFAVPFANLLEPGSNDQRTTLCRLREATIDGLLPHMCVDACRKSIWSSSSWSSCEKRICST